MSEPGRFSEINPCGWRGRLRKAPLRTEAPGIGPGLATSNGRFLALGLLLVCQIFLNGCQRFFPDEPRPFFFVDHVGKAEATFDRASFRSFRKDSALSAAMTLSDETRLSLAPPLPSQLTFTVEVPRDPALRFAMGASTLTEPSPPAPVEFRVLIDSGSGSEVCFADTLRRSQPNRWLDREVDLSRWAGSTVRLTFETRWGGRRMQSPEGGPSPTGQPVLAVWGNPVLAARGGRSERPNLVLISIDCLRPDHLGSYGYPLETSPRIDQFASDGVVFETAVASSSWTLPSHMSMLTGLPPSFHGASKWQKLDGSVAYLPELLARAGYEAAGVASWVYLSQTFGFERGFHIYRVFDQPKASELVDAALDLLRRAEGRSQFLFLHFFDPHWPYLPPEEFIEKLGPRPPDISNLLDRAGKGSPPGSEAETEQIVRLYDAEIAYADREIGRLFDEMKAMGLYDRSLILLTSDHGEAFHEHGHWQHSDTLYDEIIRIPLILKWPGKSPRERVRDLVSQADIFPTLLEQAGLEPPPTEAVGLRRYLRKAGRASPGRKTVSEVTWRSPHGTFMKISFRAQDIKYIATLEGPVGDDLAVRKIREEELYDLARDPAEKTNLAQGNSSNLVSFRRDLRAYLEEARRLRANRQGATVVLDEAARQRLRTLGYLDY